MGWFSSRQRKRQSAGKIYDGPHRSPGFEVICHFLETEPAYSVLDLGASSTENMELISDLCDDLVIQDVFHSTEANRGIRSEIFQFESAKSASLPKLSQKFDVVLVWDLLHYFAKPERKLFIERLARRCSPNAMFLIMASSIAEIPPEPIHFKTLRADKLQYCLGDERTGSPGLTTREVEQMMVGFQPVRIFQLRNGMQEMVFQLPEPPKDDSPKDKSRQAPEPVKRNEPREAQQSAPDNALESEPDDAADSSSEPSSVSSKTGSRSRGSRSRSRRHSKR